MTNYNYEEGDQQLFTNDRWDTDEIHTFDFSKKKTKQTYLLWRDVKGHSPQVDFHKVIRAGQNKEKSWKKQPAFILKFSISQVLWQSIQITIWWWKEYTDLALVKVLVNSNGTD